MSDHPKLCIGIVGGGIGGLALAVALTRLNTTDTLQVDIYESAAKLTQVGAGITIWPRGWEIIRELGLEDSLAAYICPGQEIAKDNQERIGFIYRKSDHPENAVMCDLKFRGGSLSFHRADVQQVFLAHISPSVRVHLNRRLVSYRESDGKMQLSFKNGETAACDLLIGADGVNSAAIREARPLWTGTIVYRSVIESDIIRREISDHPCLVKPLVYCGKNKHVVSYPISAGKLINVVGFVSDPTKEGTFLEGPAVMSSTPDVVSSFFTGWSEEVKCIINNMSNPLRWAIEVVKPLDKYGYGRVALLGDSAHAMPVHLGNGAGQAMEDAYILAHLLHEASKHPKIDVANLVRVYSAVRQPFGNFAARASLEQGRLYEFTELDDVREGDVLAPEMLTRLGERIADGWRWTWDSSVKGDLQRALSMLQ
ncbi:hypothetical protein HYPSUDRAFT_1023379 [Hypholoma sublateritium FD-334 SS-4]|uniref:FAD-binding domain-containing protein n=1 Tax=Hypholoma sublateritium (strain FD-334 SS-4) TaxID=945553 RepID=A0A0D2NL56_HYPSF|nr:hypothetical protein HYPSUDRAFT_1023379 [Hypholoma sublateritium FD-334 SS-4]